MSKKKEISVDVETSVILPEKKKEYQSLCRQIKACVSSLESNYIKLAVSLSRVYSGKFYEIDGYRNIYDFAKDRYHISRGTVSQYLGLVSVFGLTEDSAPVFDSTQMIAMLPYIRKGGKAEEFTPDMSVRDIKQAIRDKTAVVECPDDVSVDPVIVSQEPAHEVRNVLISCDSQEDYGSKADDIDFLICNAFAKSKSACRIEIVLVQF